MSEFTDYLLDDAMPTIPKTHVDRQAAKAVEAGSKGVGNKLDMTDMEMFPVPERPKSMQQALAAVDNMETAGDRGVDMVNLPPHYARYKIEPIRFGVENFGPGVLITKVVKYVMRYDAKNGMQDLEKAQRCLTMLTKYVDGDPDWWKKA